MRKSHTFPPGKIYWKNYLLKGLLSIQSSIQLKKSDSEKWNCEKQIVQSFTIFAKKRFPIDPLTTSNAIYRDSLTLSKNFEHLRVDTQEECHLNFSYRWAKKKH